MNSDAANPCKKLFNCHRRFCTIALPATRNDVADAVSFRRTDAINSIDGESTGQSSKRTRLRRMPAIMAIAIYERAKQFARQGERFVFAPGHTFGLRIEITKIRFAIRKRLSASRNTATTSDAAFSGQSLMQHLGRLVDSVTAFTLANPYYVTVIFSRRSMKRSQLTNFSASQILGRELSCIHRQ